MKKLYQGKGRRVYPAPADAAAAVALPAAVLALASALTAEEQEVLAYLLSGGGAAGGRRRCRGAHPPEMGCGCFSCYKSFWARWDASPNRHLIHRIIDAVEEGGGAGGGGTGPPRRPPRRRRRGRRGGGDCEEDPADSSEADANVPYHQLSGFDGGEDRYYEGDGDDDEEEGESMDSEVDDETALAESDCNNGGTTAEKSTVGRLVRFIGEKVWGAWN
ncbi:hypothetical protein GUJ93_ZPchr0458g22576 [Zizania palustris]|uniref:Uncharacterized protein n=1 Tax=Zizania palustris TaxID=103762 RepID=A0A8J5VE77_ZIZPA|nr:hypothetical protein GUJ93_ZPchr0458g22576 [Zizania palustris]